jgi:hypothetical protein
MKENTDCAEEFNKLLRESFHPNFAARDADATQESYIRSQR